MNQISNKIIITILPLLFIIIGGKYINLNKKSSFKEFDPNAGVIPSYTEGAIISVTSNKNDINKIIDDDPSTAWQSAAPLPDGFIKNNSQNILLGKTPASKGITRTNDINNAVDGDLNNMAFVHANSGSRAFSIPVNNSNLFSVSIKCQAKSDIKISAKKTTGKEELIGIYSKNDNFQLIRFEKEIKKVKELLIQSENDFGIFEIAALASPPKESVIFDFNSPKKIGVVNAKCWAGENAAKSTIVYTSNDLKNWSKAVELNPNSTHVQLIGFQERMATYLKVEHTLLPKDWNKVYFWEIKIYDKNGPFGQKPIANTGAVSIWELLGVNGYWSWGTDKYSFLLGKEEGPRRYSPIASHARNYHDMTWDINEPDKSIDFSKMKSEGTVAKEWLDWDKEYKEWVVADLDVQASLQFYRFKSDEWKRPYQSAYQYTRAFVKHFGAKNGNGFVCTIEAGNEPWQYPADVYQKILMGMLDGANAVDPGMEVFPCALQAYNPAAEYFGIFKNYIGARISKEAAAKLNGVNVHAYSYVTSKEGKRIGVHPEHPQSTFWEINNMVRWRDYNMPGKKIYLSEWGWDCGGGGEDCIHSECVSEKAAAAYAVRGAIIAGRLGVERATWYYYANEKMPSSLYTRSGLTSSINAGFQKKKVFNNLEALVRKAGDGYFLKVLREDESVWAYLYGDKFGNPKYIIAWLPLKSEKEERASVKFTFPYQIEGGWLLDGDSPKGQKIQLPSPQQGSYSLHLSTSPTIFSLKK